MPSTPQIRKRNEKYKQNIHKRGQAAKIVQKEKEGEIEDKKPSPFLVGFFVFVLFGAAFVGIFQSFLK